MDDTNASINARLADIATKFQSSIDLMAKLVGIMARLFPRSTGTFTMAAASSKTITDANVTSTSIIPLVPTNAAAATLMGSNKALYVTPASGSFVVTTASGVAAAGTETFSYSVSNVV